MATATEKRRLFEREQHLRQLQLTIGSILLFLTAFLLTVIFGGELTAPLRDALGISALMSDQAGVYADCSIAANRNNKFCRNDYSSATRREREETKFWQRPGSGPIFSLTGD